MNHLCFIVDNALTMSQPGINNISILDYVKSAIEFLLINLARRGYPSSNDHIHLFITSLPNEPLSTSQHDELHLQSQLKNIICSAPTFPAETIQQAVAHISRSRILSEAETLLGYREALPFEPALIFFFTDRMTHRKIQGMLDTVCQNKIKMRSQYQFVAFRVCPPSASEKNVYTQDKFRKNIQSLAESRMLYEVCDRLQGEMRFVCSYEGLLQSLSYIIDAFTPFLTISFEPKEIKRKIPELIPAEKGYAILNFLQSNTKIVQKQLQLSLLNLQWKAILPFLLKYSEQEPYTVEQASISPLFVDFTKQYVDSQSSSLREAKYVLAKSMLVKSLADLDESEAKYPIYFEFRKAECLIGLLSFSKKQSQVSLFCANFNQLNGIIKWYEGKGQYSVLESGWRNLMASVPAYYFKCYQQIAQGMRMSLDSYEFEQLINSRASQFQSKLRSLRSLQLRMIADQFKIQKQSHAKYESTCCPVYSREFSAYSRQKSIKEGRRDEVSEYLQVLLRDLLSCKKAMGIEDYLTMQLPEAVPMSKEIEKYSMARLDSLSENFNENISIGLGNPFQKRRKPNENEVKQPKFIQIAEQLSPIIEQKEEHEVECSSTVALKETPIDPRMKPSREKRPTIPVIQMQHAVLQKISRLPVGKPITIPFQGQRIDEKLMLNNQLLLKKYVN